MDTDITVDTFAHMPRLDLKKASPIKLIVVVKSLPQHDTDEVISTCRSTELADSTCQTLGFRGGIEPHYVTRGAGHGGLVVFPGNYFFEEKTMLWMFKQKQLKADFKERIQQVVDMYHNLVAATSEVVKIVITYPGSESLYFTAIQDAIRARKNIPPDWIFLWNESSLHEVPTFISDLLLRSAALKERK